MSGATGTARALIKVKVKDPLQDLLNSVTQTVIDMQPFCGGNEKMCDIHRDLRFLAKICHDTIAKRGTYNAR